MESTIQTFDNKQYHLPIDVLAPNVMQAIEEIADLIESVHIECDTNNLSRTLTFVREYSAMSDNFAEIEKAEDGRFHIRINDNFCQFTWAVGLYLVTYFDNYIQIPAMNFAGVNVNQLEPNFKDVEFADNQFFLARQLLKTFNRDSFWDEPNLVIPLQHSESSSKANAVYCSALAFVYAHELAHNYLGHTITANGYSTSVQDEMDADNLALSWISSSFSSKNGFTNKAGVAIVMCSLLLISPESISGGYSHPDMDIRINNLMQQLQLSEMDNLWGLVGCAIRLWLLVYGDYTIQEDMKLGPFEFYKDLFDFYLSKLSVVRMQRYPKEIKRQWEIC